MRLRFTRQARQELEDIADHIGEQNPQAALRVRTAIIGSLQTLVLFPRIGRRQKTAGVRKLVTRRYPYLVYYTIDDASEEIVILAIRHPARGREHTDA
jgi:plasmid stabilization system protein ParE